MSEWPKKMALDSESYFEQRALLFGISQPVLDGLKERRWSTFGSFAFSCSHSPGSGDEAAFLRDVVTPLAGVNPEPGQLAALRRLFFEAFTMACSDLKGRLERGDNESPKKLPRVEREDRVESVRARLPGAKLREEREPGASVVEHFAQCAEDGVLRYLPWHKTVSSRHDCH